MSTPLVRAPLAVPAAGTYRIDPARSGIAFTTRHLFGLGAVHGTFELLGGEIGVPDDPEQAWARASASAASFASGHPGRDRAVCSPRLLDVAAHPTITFVSERLVAADGAPALVGQLTVRGITAEVALAIEDIDCSGRELRASAGTRIDRYAFAVTGYRGLAARYLDVRLDVVAVRG